MSVKACWSKKLRWSVPSKIVWPMLISALRSAKERRFTATNRIRRWLCEWRNRLGKCFPAALQKKRARLRRTPPFVAAVEWVGLHPGERWTKKPYVQP
jgi:hypothetical protein